MAKNIDNERTQVKMHLLNLLEQKKMTQKEVH